MTQPGGSATMYGVLYQLLGTAHWAGKIQLSTFTDGGEWTEARLVIEPPGGGGDILIESPERRIVEQWKSKSDRGSWGLRRVITDVLPDLYRAVDLGALKRKTEFRFVTEGRRGRWDEAERFFAELSGDSVPDDPFAALDDNESIHFSRGEHFTKLAFFRFILASLREHPDIARDSETECATKLRYLLGRFVIHGDRTAEKLVCELDGFLRPLVDYSEDVEPKRRELCTALLELAAQGNASFTAQELLSKVNLDGTSFCDWAKARAAILETTQRTLQSRWRYCTELDVRSPERQPKNMDVCVLTGESGQGKTWRLATLALDAFADGSLAVAVSATGDAEQDLQKAAEIVWRDGFQREGPTDLELVAKKRREFLPKLPTPWLTICVDDIQSMAEARSLIERDWSSWEIRLALTALPPVAQALKTQYGQDVLIVEVDDFRIRELQEYLQINGHEWGMLPADVRTILRKPLLASLYCDIAGDGTWRPTDEYALFARSWRRIRDDRNQVDHPGDIAAMKQLASMFLDADVVYPWPQSVCESCGVSSEMQRRLESVGWLRRTEDDRVEVTHDRLLNWAVAEALVAKRVARELSADDLAGFLGNEALSSSERRLEYVPMDVCWMMSDSARHLEGELAAVIAALEDKTSVWRSEPLYKELLPTLGPRIIPPMVERVRAAVSKDATADDLGAFSRLLADATVRIGKRHPNDVAKWGGRMLVDECEAIRQAGLRVLKRFPIAAALDKLWEMHKVNFDVYVRKAGENWWVGYERTFAALKSCTRLNPKWLERQIQESSDETDPISELAYLVATLQGGAGKALWRRVKTALFTKVPPDKPRCLATCIQQHADSTEVPRLESWLEHTDDDLAPDVAFATLVHLAPQRALRSLRRFDARRLYGTRRWWLPGLLLRFPNETRDQIRRTIESSASTRWQAALVYQDDPNQMDERTLNLLLDELQSLVRDAAELSETHAKDRLFGPLGLLADVSRFDLLCQFEARAETPLEQHLTKLACSWVGRMTTCVDRELDLAIRVLVMLAGSGLTRVVNKQLSSESKFARLDGIRLSLAQPDSETRRLLANITESPDTWDEKQPFPLLQAEATVALAALGENRAVVTAILRWGTFLNELHEMREGQPPMTDDDLTGAIEALEDSDEEKRTNALFALSVSGRVDFAPQIRQVLKDADPESKLAKAAIVALDYLGDTHPEAISLLKSQLKIPEHADAASLALLRNGKSESLAILEEELRRRGMTPGVMATNLIAVNLGMRPETRKTVAEVLWKSIREGGGRPFWMTPDWECLAEIDAPEVWEFLVEEAHAPERWIHIVGQKVGAIRALAKVDRDSAFRAAETALRADRKDLELYPDALMEIDEPRAIAVLFEVYSDSLPALAKSAVGRALRRANEQTMVHSTLDRMMRAESCETRIIAVELNGWQLPGVLSNRLRQMAVEDSDGVVRRAAEKSATRNERQQFALELLQVLEKTQGTRCWSYLEAVVRLGDPWLITTRGDPLFIWDRLSGKPPGLKRHALQLIKKRMDDVKNEAKKADRKGVS